MHICLIATLCSVSLIPNFLPLAAAHNSPADIDGSGLVDTGDLLAVIAPWGQCE